MTIILAWVFLFGLAGVMAWLTMRKGGTSPYYDRQRDEERRKMREDRRDPGES